MVIDNTLSMGTRVDGDTRLARALDLAERFIRAADAPIALCTFDGQLHPLSHLQRNRQALLKQLQYVRLSARAAGLQELVSSVAAYPNLREVEDMVFISDFQRQWYGDTRLVRTALARLASLESIGLVPVDRRSDVRNLALREARLAPEGLHIGRESELRVRVENTSSQPVEGVPLTLTLSGERQDRVIASLAPGEARWLSLVFTVKSAGDHELVAALPQDDFPADDRFFVHLRAERQLRVVGVVPPPVAGEPTARDAFFKAALRAVGAGEGWEYERILPEQLYSRRLEDYDVIVLFGVSVRENDDTTGRLREALALGRGVIAFADDTAVDAWSGFGVADGGVSREKRSVDPTRLPRTYLEFMHGKGLDPRLIRFTTWRPITPGDGDSGRLYLEGVQQPVVLRRAVGPGVLVCAGFIPGPGYTDLYYNPNMVQFTVRLLQEASNRDPTDVVMGTDVGRLRLPGLTRTGRYAVSSPSGARAELQVQEDDDGLSLLAEPEPEGGFFAVLEEGRPVSTFGYNPTREDSAVESVGEALLRGSAVPGQDESVHVLHEARFVSMAATRELAGLLALLFVLALVFENYAHLIRTG